MQLRRQLTVLGAIALLAGCASGDDATEASGVFKGFIGAVAVDEPRAALEGRRVLAEGGTAADAATAIYFSLAATLPSAASLGGGGVCVVLEQEKGRVEALDFLTRAPKPSGRAVERPNAVPGNAIGFFALHSRYGRLPWPRVVSPGERLARFGTQISRALARDLKGIAGPLLEDPEARRIFGKSGGVLGEGDFLRQPDLSAVLSSIRSLGPGDLYRGSFAKILVDGVAAAGGALTAADLRDYRPRWLPTLTYTYGNIVRKFVVHVPPPPAAAGVVAGQMVAMLQSQGDFAGGGESERNHLLVETATRAFGDRAAWLGADFRSSVPTKELLGDARISSLLANLDPARHTSPSALANKPVARAENPSSTSFVVADRDGGAVSCALTMNNAFGTGRIVRGTGIVLAAQPGGEGRGPLPLGPMLVVSENTHQLYFAGAASGGAPSPTALAAVAARTLLAEQPVRKAVEAPRVHHSGAPDITFHEPTLEPAVRSALIARSHKLAVTPRLGRVNAIYCAGGLPRDPDTCGVAVDPRGHGLALSAIE